MQNLRLQTFENAVADVPGDGIIRAMMGSAVSTNILERILSSNEDLSSEVARFFLGMSLTQPDLDRIAVLSEKANEGELNSEENDELRLYVLLADFLTIMHSRAEDALRAKSPAA
jgi:hypothetical protein